MTVVNYSVIDYFAKLSIATSPTGGYYPYCDVTKGIGIQSEAILPCAVSWILGHFTAVDRRSVSRCLGCFVVCWFLLWTKNKSDKRLKTQWAGPLVDTISSSTATGAVLLIERWKVTPFPSMVLTHIKIRVKDSASSCSDWVLHVSTDRQTESVMERLRREEKMTDGRLKEARQRRGGRR